MTYEFYVLTPEPWGEMNVSGPFATEDEAAEVLAPRSFIVKRIAPVAKTAGPETVTTDQLAASHERYLEADGRLSRGMQQSSPETDRTARYEAMRDWLTSLPADKQIEAAFNYARNKYGKEV